MASSQKQRSETKNSNKNDKEVKNGEVRNEVFNDGINQQIKAEDTKKPEKKAEPIRDKSKPISSSPVSGTPWYDIPMISTFPYFLNFL